MSVGSDPSVHEAFHTVVLSADKRETGVEITAVEDGAEVILVSFSLLSFDSVLSHTP